MGQRSRGRKHLSSLMRETTRPVQVLENTVHVSHSVCWIRRKEGVADLAS